MAEPTDFFIDESGNTGDLATAKGPGYVAEQRIFSLAAMGGALDDDIVAEFRALKSRHRLQSDEVKSKHTYDKPRFLTELLDLIDERKIPVFIELVDKHYFVVMNMVERMVMPYVGPMDLTPGAMWMKGVMADCIALSAPRRLAEGFIACCGSRDFDDLDRLYADILDWAEKATTIPTEVAQGIARFVEDSWTDFRGIPRGKAVERALPVPDSSSSGKVLWVLPNLSSFTHIYARINLFKNKRLAGVILYHDEQLQFGDIFLHNKMLAEALAGERVRLPLKTSDFAFGETAELKFIKSHDSVGIQIADTLAGFASRYVQDVVWGGGPVRSDKSEIFGRLVTMGRPERGTGINIVAPGNLVRFLGIAPTANY